MRLLVEYAVARPLWLLSASGWAFWVTAHVLAAPWRWVA